MADTFKSGKTGTATFNGTELAVISWEINPSTTNVNFRNSRTGSFSKIEPTFHSATGTVTIDRDFDAAFSDAPTSIVTGAVLTNLKLYLAGTAGIFWLLPSIVVTGTPESLNVDGKIATRITFVADGTFTYPSGAVPT